ncbi:MAG: hypothetical protein SOT35_02560 [Bullifex sp.]|nr:hypothetical protein [Bullifex sp.]
MPRTSNPAITSAKDYGERGPVTAAEAGLEGVSSASSGIYVTCTETNRSVTPPVGGQMHGIRTVS